MSVQLKLTASWDGSVDGGSIRTVSDTSWGETTITYNNRPAVSANTVASIGAINAGQSVTVDVTSAVSGNGLVSLAITSTSGDGVAYASRESNTPPTLIVTEGDYGTPTPTATSTPTTTPTSTSTSTSTPTASGTPSGDPVIAAAGDIACDPTSTNFNGGLGDATHCQEKATSDLLVGRQLTAVLALGDTQYDSGTLEQYQASYDPTWGRVKSITLPDPGNHEYRTAGATGYYDYFGSAAGDPTKGYYSVDVGTWHIIALNGECDQIGGCNSGSPEDQWLQSDLASHSNMCTLAMLHEPEYDSGPNASTTTYLTFWQDLYNAGADVILDGHSHLYERFAPQSPSGALDTAYGITQFTVGTGGDSLDHFHTIRPNSLARNDTDFGVLLLTLHPTSYDWQFVPIAGGTYSDSGTANCHSAP